jgi:hypothetical protein
MSETKLHPLFEEILEKVALLGPIAEIKAGDRVTILVPVGIGRNGIEYKEKTGRAVMKGPYGWALNMGGRHGTPGVATAKNIVRVEK